MIGGVTIWEIVWTAGLPQLSGLPYLPRVTYLHLISPYSVRENIEQNKRDFERGYFNARSRNTDCIKFTDRNAALRNKTKQTKEILLFLTSTYNTYNPATPNLKRILMKHWTSFNSNLSLNISLTESSIVSYRKEKSLKNILVRAKIPSISQPSQHQRSG